MLLVRNAGDGFQANIAPLQSIYDVFLVIPECFHFVSVLFIGMFVPCLVQVFCNFQVRSLIVNGV